MKTSKRFFKILVVLTLFHLQVLGNKNVSCTLESRNGRLLNIGYLRNKGKCLFYLVSYANFSISGDKLQSFVKKYVFEKKRVHKALTIGMRMGFHFEYDYGDRISLFDLERVELPSNFQQNVSCSVEPIPFYKTADIKLKSEESLPPTFFYGCKVQKVMEKFIVEKIAVLVANNADGLRYTEQQVADLGSPEMIDLNYSMFEANGFCVCDDIIEFVRCGETKDKTESNNAF